MAKKFWDEPIDKNVNWAGDDSTEGLPVSGEMVQKFIKDSLNSKAGVFYYDTSNNRYLVFADDETKEEYILNPTRTDLIIGNFDAPFNYTAEINLSTATYNAIAYGKTGNYIDFTFDIKNKQGTSTGENVVVTYTVIRNASKQVIKETRVYGESVHFNVDKYLGDGVNTVIVSILGQNTLAATTASITYQVVKLTLEDVLDISTVYNLNEGTNIMEIPFTVSGYGTKIVEWYVDGEQLEFVKSDDEIVDVISTRTKYIDLSNLQQGVHHLEVRAYTVVNGDNFYTDTLYRDFFVYTGANKDNMVGVALSIPAGEPMAGIDAVRIYDMVQYIPYKLRFAIYSPSNAASIDITIKLDDEVLGMVSTKNREEYEFVITPSTSGDKVLYLSSSTFEYAIPTTISPTSIRLEEITNDLVLDFNGKGKSNDSIDKDYWIQGDYVATFNGFEWTNKSGWNNGRLEMNAGTSFGIDYAPLAGKLTDSGKTIEIEWATKNVINDDAIICDLRRDDGTGILITATKVSLTSADGVTIDTEYKSDENVRIAFVINKASNTTNQHMSFIYCNGVISRGETWATSDSYTSNKEILFTATKDAEISLKAIRVYNTALSSDDILNNYTLYRDNLDEMLDIYERNDIYEEGTKTFSPERMMGRLPVMIVTGDIPTLENTSDKNTQIVVDIDYYNMQDTTKSFRMQGAAMRPQGTSSMGYPKKNFRIYTQELDGTILYDSNNQVVKDKLYSFKEGAQPVNCWCLKADYAESSGTHNTGIARLWNKALYDARVTVDLGEGNPHNVDRASVLRTEAQNKALEANYPYDVRTTIDGFPILLFYRLKEDDAPIFIGKYNFNNDKSTESVFGFTGIPGFDNSRMQCWEILNNGNALALFNTVEGFDANWKDAFESRYPDTKNPYTGDLKAFCEWMSNVSEEDFITEKWNHIDVYKIAAYWVYLMRHAGADQFVKNAMLTSEDGEHFYFILYDNDTINGLINSGHLRLKPTVDRQTVDSSGSYVFAGHDSRLWNLLEADEEFNEIVAAVDNALYSAGISYINTVKIFDGEQANKWVERVYNQDAQYKYVGPYTVDGTNNLFMMQGRRDLHRRWWLSKRFSIFDAKYVSGTYKSEAVEIKCLNGTEAGQQFTIKAGYPLDYGYGINNKPRAKGITLNIGDTHTFTTEEVINIGDPLRIYGAPNIAELDLSQMSNRLATLTVTGANSNTIGTKMTKLIVGNSNTTNNELKEISGLKQLTSLEYLDIQGMKNFTSLDLSNQPMMKTLKAFNSNIASVSFAKGAPIEKLELPSTVKMLDFNKLPKLNTNNLLLEEGFSGISHLSIKDCPKLSKDFNFIHNWYLDKETSDETSYLYVDNIDWKDVNADMLIDLANIGNVTLKGKVVVTSITLEQINRLIEVFGESAFDKNSDFYINAPDAIFVAGPTELLEGENGQYTCVVFGADVESLSWSIYSGGSSSYTTIDANTGLLTTKEGSGSRTLTIRVVARTSAGTKSLDTSVKVNARTYPNSSTTSITGNGSLSYTREVYKLEVTTPNVNGEYVVTWSLTGMDGYAEIESSNNTQCVIKTLQVATTVVTGTLTAALKKKANNYNLFSKTFTLELVNDMIAETDKGVVSAFYNKGYCANSAYITKEEAARITDVDIQPGTSESQVIFYGKGISEFEGFQYFIGLTKVPNYCFSKQHLTKLFIPEGVTYMGGYVFYYLSANMHMKIPSTLVSMSPDAFRSSSSSGGTTAAIKGNWYFEVSKDNPVYTSEDGILYTKEGKLVRFRRGKNLPDFVIPSWVTTIAENAFYFDRLESLTFNHNVSVSSYAFDNACIEKKLIINAPTFNTSISHESSAELYIGKGVQELGPKVAQDWKNIITETGSIYSVVNDLIIKNQTHLVSYTGNTGSEIIIPEGVETIEKNCFNGKSATLLVFPEGLEEIPQSCCCNYTTYSEVRFPSTLTKIGLYAFETSTVEKFYCAAKTPPSVATLGLSVLSSKPTPICCVPVSSIELYKAADGWKNFIITHDVEPQECVSLSITAEDVAAHKTTTTINYVALVNGIDRLTGEYVENIEITGSVISTDFPMNESTSNVERSISYTYLGVTATTTIVQEAWKNGVYEIDFNDQWEKSTKSSDNPDETMYDGLYQTKNTQTHTHYSMYITIIGYDSFQLYVRSNTYYPGEGVSVYELDDDETIKFKTSSNSSSTAISAYNLVEFTNIGGGIHRFRVNFYRTLTNGHDKGYVLIPKNQEGI